MLEAALGYRSGAVAVLVLSLGVPFSGCGGDEFAPVGEAGGSGQSDASPDQSTDSSAGGKGGAAGGASDAGKSGAAGKGGTGQGGAGGAAAGGQGGEPGAGGATPDACVPESLDGLCAAKQATCGTISGTDNCGTAYTHSCGTCGCGFSCTSEQKCEAVACSVQLGAQGCDCDKTCCGGSCNGDSCCIGNSASCGAGTQCGENSNCCSGQCNNGQCWGSDLTCTP